MSIQDALEIFRNIGEVVTKKLNYQENRKTDEFVLDVKRMLKSRSNRFGLYNPVKFG